MHVLLLALLVMAGCVVIHALGIVFVLRQLQRPSRVGHRFWRVTGALIRLAVWMIVFHLIEVSAWALMFVLVGAMPDARTGFYFSMVTYTTTGYGDLVLPQDWRLAGGIEALTGILMCGWSTAFFFAAFTKISEGAERTP